MEFKQCTQCYKQKPLEEFYRDATKSDGRTSACKPCRNKQTSEARRKRIQRSRGLVVDESPRLLEHNLRTLENLLGAGQAPNMVLRTRLGESINPNPQGLVISDGWARIETVRGSVSKDLSRCSILELARFLELNRIRIEAKENVSV